jgi:hypothetical protein
MTSDNTEQKWVEAGGDYEFVKEWMQQTPPAASELTEEDVWNAYLAQDVIHHWHQHTAFMPFDVGRTLAAWEASNGKKWAEIMSMIARGISVLNGYLLVTNKRVPVWQDAPTHDVAVVSRKMTGGYVANQEMHRTYSLVKADDLITISTAAQILYGENTQSKRVMLVDDIHEGYLQVFFDRSEPNPQKAKRVSKRQVLSLKYQRDQR